MNATEHVPAGMACACGEMVWSVEHAIRPDLCADATWQAKTPISPTGQSAAEPIAKENP
jgi:hypothetical protein